MQEDHDKFKADLSARMSKLGAPVPSGIPKDELDALMNQKS